MSIWRFGWRGGWKIGREVTDFSGFRLNQTLLGYYRFVGIYLTQRREIEHMGNSVNSYCQNCGHKKSLMTGGRMSNHTTYAA